MEIIKKNNIKKIITALKKGAVLVLPTDTVYGLVCDASNKKAVEKIFKIKKRDKSKTLGVFVKDIKSAKKLAIVDKAEKFLKNNKNTLILRAEGRTLSNLVYGNIPMAKPSRILGAHDNGRGIGTIGIRIPKHKFLNLILDKFKKPLAQTSANISGRPILTNIYDIVKTFENSKIKPDLVIDGGDLSRPDRGRGRGSSMKSGPKNKPSAIIDLSESKIKILRK